MKLSTIHSAWFVQRVPLAGAVRSISNLEARLATEEEHDEGISHFLFWVKFSQVKVPVVLSFCVTVMRT